MANVFDTFEQRIRETLQTLDLVPEDAGILDRITVETPRDAAHGDLATNAAMVLAKPLKQNPRAIAERLADALREGADVEAVDVAGPGFLNLRLAPGVWQEQLRTVLAAGSGYGAGAATGHRVNVEYVSANPTGPMHVGHCRGAVVGDALANLLAFAGDEVVREYYINDAGGQIEVLARSAYLRYREALGEDIGAIPEGLYPGDYLVPVGEALAREHGDALAGMEEADWLPIVKDAAINAMMALIREDLATLGVEHDVFFSERTLHAKSGNTSAISETVAELEGKGLIYTGTLPKPKGEAAGDWEDREQLLFRSTDVGDDMDRALVKSNGDYTYFAADVGYFRDKFRRGFDEMVFILGADHGGYVKRMEALGRAVSDGKAAVTIRLVQLVKLFRDGKPVTMGKRSGNFVTLRDVVDEVGRDAVRFMMLYRKNTEPLDFDFAKVTEQSKDNPVFYVQYAHARCRSVLRQAGRELSDLDTDAAALVDADLSALDDAGEMALVRKMAEWPRVVQGAARGHEPHRIAFYLHDLASLFHSHWNRGTAEPALRFVHPDDAKLTAARLGLVQAVSQVIASGLAIIGAKAPEEMR